MGRVDTLLAFERATAQFRALYGFTPERLVTDLHPGYVTRQWAERHDRDVVGVQHHHAHAAALMAEHELPPDATILVFAFDGTGFGTDGTVWGGEALVTSYAHAERVGHLRTVDLPGGDAALHAPARIALAHLRAAGVAWTDDLDPVRAVDRAAREVLDAQLARCVGCVQSSSAGRLFDAASSLLGIRHIASYEGQAAVELEAAATRANDDGPALAFTIDDGVVDPAPVLHELAAARREGVSVNALARAFHRALADAIATLATDIADVTGIRTVGLTGGVFQNALLTTCTSRRLTDRGFEVLVHRRVPPNDGGLALGQAAVAAVRMREPAA
jgi:hydrogenase maturation protein HypF